MTSLQLRLKPRRVSGPESLCPTDELVSFLACDCLEADQYRTLRHEVEALQRDAHLNVLGITSAGAGEGKTVTTLNLAGALAQAPGARVLCIDADLHRSGVAQALGIVDTKALRGLANVLGNEQRRLSETLYRLDSLNLSVLFSGRVRTGVYELLASPRLGEVLAEARRLYDYVLIDTPPLMAVADSRLLERWVDGFLVVVRAHHTPRKLLAEALSRLTPAKVVGLVFNGDDRPLRSYYGYYQHYYRQHLPLKHPARLRRPDVQGPQRGPQNALETSRSPGMGNDGGTGQELVRGDASATGARGQGGTR